MAKSQDLGLQGDPRSKQREQRGQESSEEETDHTEAPKMNGIMSIVPSEDVTLNPEVQESQQFRVFGTHRLQSSS
jgi:hypothetical protein